MKDGVKRIELERQIKEEKEKELVERGREWIDVEKGDMGLREKKEKVEIRICQVDTSGEIIILS